MMISTPLTCINHAIRTHQTENHVYSTSFENMFYPMIFFCALDTVLAKVVFMRVNRTTNSSF